MLQLSIDGREVPIVVPPERYGRVHAMIGHGAS